MFIVYMQNYQVCGKLYYILNIFWNLGILLVTLIAEKAYYV